MAASRVLVTGVGRDLGAVLARMLSDDAAIESVVGVDTHPPRTDLGRAEFVRADIRNPLIAKVIASSRIDTVVHMSVLPSPLLAGSRAAMKEVNVIGSMQLLAACQKASTVRTLVLKSTTQVYGRSARDPAVLDEDSEPREIPTSGYPKDAVEVEGYVRGFTRRRPDVTVSVLRFADFIGPRIDSVLRFADFIGPRIDSATTRYFNTPVAPTVLGADPRLQLCHEDDALAVLRLAADGARPGTYNVAGDGVLLLSQALRRLGRPSIALPAAVGGPVGRLLGVAGADVLSAEQIGVLGHGRVVSTDALRRGFGYVPRFTTPAAFEDFAAAHPGPLRRLPVVALAEAGARHLLERRRTVRA